MSSTKSGARAGGTDPVSSTGLYSSEHASFYDALHATYVGDRAFYLKQVRRAEGPVLEIACGTGRLGLELASECSNYTGMDLSESMLEVFRRKWRSMLPGEPRLVCADMRDFDLGRRFSLVLITFNSLQHVHRDEEVLKVFGCCRRHLDEHGRLVFDVFNPDPRFLDRDPAKRYPVVKFFDEGRGEWCELSESNRFDRQSKVNSIRWFYRYENGESGMFQLEMRQFFPQELDALVEKAGFKIAKKSGDFVGSGFGTASPRQVFECA